LDQAALLSCAVLTGFGAVHNTARVAAGSRVAVYGCGAFEALGREETVQQAWASLDVRRQLVLVGLLPSGARVTLDAGPFVSEQSVKGCYFGSADLHRDIPVLVGHDLRGDLALDELITLRITLDQLEEAFDDLRAGRGARSVLVFDRRSGRDSGIDRNRGTGQDPVPGNVP
jgi:Zn-dependent alcohol dehydrogenase